MSSTLPFNRRIVRNLERGWERDFNEAQTFIDKTLRFLLYYLHSYGNGISGYNTGQGPDGFVGDGFRVVPQSPASLSVKVLSGFGLTLPGSMADGKPVVTTDYDGIAGLDDAALSKPLVLNAATNFTVPTPPTGSEFGRTDIIEVRAQRDYDTATESSDFLSPATGIWSTDPAVKKNLVFASDLSTGSVVSPANSTAALSYKKGATTFGGYGVPPPTTSPGYLKLCEIYMDNFSTSITEKDIVDKRQALLLGGVASAGFRCHVVVPYTGSMGAPTAFTFAAPPGFNIYAAARSGSNVLLDVYVVGPYAPRGYMTVGSGAAQLLLTAALTSGTVSSGVATQIASSGLNAGGAKKVGVGSYMLSSYVQFPTPTLGTNASYDLTATIVLGGI